MNSYEYTAKSSDEAIRIGLEELQTTKDRVKIEILEEGGGFLGLKKAKVRITKLASDGERAVEFLNGLLSIMKTSSKCNLISEDEKILIKLTGTDSSSLIGYRGEVLDSLQTLASSIANIGKEKYRRVVVDCENYREKREETLISLANKLALKAIRLGKKVSLEPMNPYERRVIHSALSENAEVKTLSDGKEGSRFITIIPNNLRAYTERRPFNNDRPFNKDSANRPFNNDRPFNKDTASRPFNNDRPFNKDSASRPFNNDRPFLKTNDNKANPEKSTEQPKKEETYLKQFNSGFKRPQATSSATKTTFSGFGTFLGNSKDLEEDKD